MGQVASEYADIIILTSDNPRSESPVDIINDILFGIEKNKQKDVLVELDREKAIHKAYSLSFENSAIILLGKGPDEYQIIGDKKSFFSEKLIIKSISEKRV